MKFNLLTLMFMLNVCSLSANPPVIETNPHQLAQVNNHNQNIVNVLTGAAVTNNTYPQHYSSEFPGAGFVPHYYNNTGATQPQNVNGQVVINANQAG